MSQIKIGRSSDNHIVFNYPQISRYHAELTRLSPNTFIIEDKDSTSGTFVNGLRINRSVVNLDDAITLADKSLQLHDYFSSAQTVSAAPELIKQVQVEDMKVPLGINPEFYKLKYVWENYTELKNSIKRNQSIKAGLLKTVLGMIPFVETGLGILAAANLTPEEKLQALDMEFELKYVCPSCRSSIKKVSWAFLRTNQKKCTQPKCQATWVEEWA